MNHGIVFEELLAEGPWPEPGEVVLIHINIVRPVDAPEVLGAQSPARTARPELKANIVSAVLARVQDGFGGTRPLHWIVVGVQSDGEGYHGQRQTAVALKDVNGWARPHGWIRSRHGHSVKVGRHDLPKPPGQELVARGVDPLNPNDHSDL